MTDLHLFVGLSGTEAFFRTLGGKANLGGIHFDDEDVRDSFQRADFKQKRSAAFSKKTLWDTLTERTIPRFDREGAETYVCVLSGEMENCGLVFASWIKFMAHQTHNKSGNRGIKSPLRLSILTNQCVICGSTFADRSTAQNHFVNAWTRGTCRADRSHMTGHWERSHSRSAATSSARFGRFAKVQRTCSHDPFAFRITDDPRESTCPACSTTQTPQATLKRWT